MAKIKTPADLPEFAYLKKNDHQVGGSQSDRTMKVVGEPVLPWRRSLSKLFQQEIRHKKSAEGKESIHRWITVKDDGIVSSMDHSVK